MTIRYLYNNLYIQIVEKFYLNMIKFDAKKLL